MALSMLLHLELGRLRSTKLPKTEVDLWRAGGCTDAKTYGPQAGWCMRNPKMPERETPGAARSGVAAAPRASAQAKPSWTQHDAPNIELVCWSEGYDVPLRRELTRSSSLFLSFLR